MQSVVRRICRMNWKIINAAFWIEMILSYLLPFQITDGTQYQVGFPVPFIFVDAGEFHTSPFMSMHVNPLGLLLNGGIMYMILICCNKIYQKIRRNRTK